MDIQSSIELAGFTALAWFLVKNQTKQNNFFVSQMSEITKSIKIMANNVGRTLLNPEQTHIIFQAVLNEHIEKKVNYAVDILKANSIKTRRCSIEKNLRSKFISITTFEAHKLSEFNTKAGDLGKILLDYMIWDKFMEDVYEIFFSEHTVENKEKDLRSYMNGHLNKLLEIIDTKIRENTI